MAAHKWTPQYDQFYVFFWHLDFEPNVAVFVWSQLARRQTLHVPIVSMCCVSFVGDETRCCGSEGKDGGWQIMTNHISNHFPNMQPMSLMLPISSISMFDSFHVSLRKESRLTGSWHIFCICSCLIEWKQSDSHVKIKEVQSPQPHQTSDAQHMTWLSITSRHISLRGAVKW